MKNFIKKITLKEGITIYLKWKQSHTTSAYNKYRVRLEHFENYLKESKNKINLNEITPDDIVDFHNHMTKAYSPATVAYSARILKNFFDFHKGRDHTRVNPKEIISVRFLNADKEVVDQEDFDLMMELLNEVYLLELQKKLVLSLLWDTGMRVSELLDLDISHINDQGKSGLRTAKIKTKKTMRYNLVVWGSKTNGLLNQYLAWRLMVNHPTDALFISTYDRTGSLKRLSSRTIQRWVKELSKEAMIGKKLTPHSFRHGKAHEILNQGGTAVDVQALLRHRNLNSSLNYMQLNESRYLQTAERFLEKELKPVPTGYRINLNPLANVA